MNVADTITYGRLPYWKHNGHTATVSSRVEFADGTADVAFVCSCGEHWSISEGIDV